MVTPLSSLGMLIPWRCGQSRISSVLVMLSFETGSFSTDQTRSSSMYSSDNRAFTVRLTSSPDRLVLSALMVVRENDVGEPLIPSSSKRCCRHRVVSEPSSRKAYVSTSRPSLAETRTGMILKLILVLLAFVTKSAPASM